MIRSFHRIYSYFHSPSHLQIDCPITFILGGKDTRVVNQHTLEAVRLLRAKGKSVKQGDNDDDDDDNNEYLIGRVIMNEQDNHFLQTPRTADITAVQVIRFFV